MMSSSAWKSFVIEAVRDVADREFQERSWFNKSTTEVSSPDEVICTLFDDALFEEFLESDEIGLNDIQRQLGKKLAKAMSQYNCIIDTKLDAQAVFDDPTWGRIRKLAQDFLDSILGRTF